MTLEKVLSIISVSGKVTLEEIIVLNIRQVVYYHTSRGRGGDLQGVTKPHLEGHLFILSKDGTFFLSSSTLSIFC